MCPTNTFSSSLYRAVELANSIKTEHPTNVPTVEHSSLFAGEYTVYCMGRSLYDLRQFRRASHTLKNCNSDEAFFLRNYCLYLV